MLTKGKNSLGQKVVFPAAAKSLQRNRTETFWSPWVRNRNTIIRLSTVPLLGSRGRNGVIINSISTKRYANHACLLACFALTLNGAFRDVHNRVPSRLARRRESGASGEIPAATGVFPVHHRRGIWRNDRAEAPKGFLWKALERAPRSYAPYLTLLPAISKGSGGPVTDGAAALAAWKAYFCDVPRSEPLPTEGAEFAGAIKSGVGRRAVEDLLRGIENREECEEQGVRR